jgi:glutathione synthase/RimK-type ligase-like ATP-grasp enzyme
MTAATHIAFATWSGDPSLTDDDQRAAEACRARGVAVEAMAWDRPADWRRFDAVVLRSTWNYHLLPAQFAEWLAQLDAVGARVWNPTPVVRWNADKRYLLELQQAGVRIPETSVVPRGSRASLVDLLRAHDWPSAVVKPAISASAFLTTRVDADTAAAAQPAFEAAVADRDMLVQRLLPEVAEGELSLMFFGGAFSHAILKRPKPGEFRVQEHHGGTARRIDVDAETLATCRHILAQLPSSLLYIRVDGILTADGFILVEVEAIEPSLFFEYDPASADRFATALTRI